LAEGLVAEVVEVDDDPEALYRLSLEQGWGDGVPILPPTDERIAALLAATPRPPDEIVGVLPPRHGVATVELAAINAAMAGVEPAAFPLVLAALEAISAPEFNAFALTTTTSSVFPMLIVNGPGRDELGIDCRAGCMGGAAGRGSMTIGRAVSLCLRNVGGQRAGETSRTVFGQPARFGLCFGEWEERSPWPSLARRRGFRADQDVVTVHGGKGTFPLADVNNDDARDLAYTIAKNPVWAARFGDAFAGVEAFQRYLFEHAWQPIDLWRPANQAILRAKGRVDAGGRVFLVERPEQLVPIVCGGLGSLHAIALTSFCESQMQSVAALRRHPGRA